MTDTADTIELLEAIGSDASLRYAQGNELMGVLEQAQASAAFTAAVIDGSGALLRKESMAHQVPQVSQTNAPGYGDDEEEEGEGDAPQPEPRGPASSPSSARELQ